MKVLRNQIPIINTPVNIISIISLPLSLRIMKNLHLSAVTFGILAVAQINRPGNMTMQARSHPPCSP